MLYKVVQTTGSIHGACNGITILAGIDDVEIALEIAEYYSSKCKEKGMFFLVKHDFESKLIVGG